MEQAIPSERAAGVDVLRGFALMGIIWVNAPLFAYNPALPTPIDSAADSFAVWLTTTVAQGKFFILFSFLFGFGISQMLARSNAADFQDVRGRYVRRAVGLWIIGLVHAVFLFFGDILMLYAGLSLIVWIFRRKSNRFLLCCAIGVFFIGVVSQTVVMLPQWMELAEGEVAANTVASGFGGTYLDAMRERLMVLPIAIVFVMFFNGPVACALFFLGFLAGRSGVFPVASALLQRLWRPAGGAFALGLAMSGASAYLFLDRDYSEVTPFVLAGVGLSLGAPLMSFGIAIGVLRWAELSAGGWLAGCLATVGRMSLTGYIMHSVLLGFIFYGWGLGWFEKVDQLGVIAIAFGVFGVIVAMLTLWSRWFRYGPEEWLLRSFIDLKWKPLRVRERQKGSGL